MFLKGIGRYSRTSQLVASHTTRQKMLSIHPLFLEACRLDIWHSLRQHGNVFPASSQYHYLGQMLSTQARKPDIGDSLLGASVDEQRI